MCAMNRLCLLSKCAQFTDGRPLPPLVPLSKTNKLYHPEELDCSLLQGFCLVTFSPLPSRFDNFPLTTAACVIHPPTPHPHPAPTWVINCRDARRSSSIYSAFSITSTLPVRHLLLTHTTTNSAGKTNHTGSLQVFSMLGLLSL